jgi:hypothetical protein
MGPYNRFNAIEALATSKGFDNAVLKSIRRLRREAYEALQQRNRFVHDAWYVGGGAVSQFKSFSVKDQKFGVHEVTEADARKAIESISKQADKVAALARAIGSRRTCSAR